MRLKGLAAWVMFMALAQGTAAAVAQASGAPATTPATQDQLPLSQTAQPDCNGIPCDRQVPHITVANPPPATAPPWSMPDRIAWAANLVLVLLGYAGIMLAVSTLKKIERQTRVAEATAEAALAAANAAQLSAQAVVDSERPWIIVTPRPSQTAENTFTIMATNRGRTPARIQATAERVRIAADDSQLPQFPEYKQEEVAPPLVPIILLPGESTALKPFSRADVKGLCASEEEFSRVESWEDKVFLYGKVTYRDLIAPAGQQTHETDWCCWYIHGRQRSGLVIAGPPEYNKHT